MDTTEPMPTAFAVLVSRTGEGARLWNGSDELPINYWHHPCGMKPTANPPGYEGVPMVQPVNAVRFPVLRFATMGEAEIAADFFNALWGKGASQEGWREDVYPGEYVGRAVEVDAEPNVTLSASGFAPIPVGLFA